MQCSPLTLLSVLKRMISVMHFLFFNVKDLGWSLIKQADLHGLALSIRISSQQPKYNIVKRIADLSAWQPFVRSDQMTAPNPKQRRHAITQKNVLAPKISGQQSYSISEDRAQRLISSSELTSSILASSASVNSKFRTAPTQSTICSGREAPIRAVVIRSPLSTQASAI